MRRLWPSAALLAMTAGLVPATAAAQDAARSSLVHQTTLDNGLQVLVEESHAVPLATVLVAVHTGAMTQDSGERGLAHLYEHLLFRAFGGDPSDFARSANALDAQYNGTTSDEVVTYYLLLPSKNALKGIALLGQLLQKPRFNAYDLEQERPVVLDELQRDASDPEQALDRQASQLLWGPSWSRKDVGGDSATLQAITLAHLRETYARYYVPNNTVLVVTGDVASTDVFAAAREQLGSWPRAPDAFADRPIPAVGPLTASTAGLIARPVVHANIAVYLRGPSVGADTAATYAADALCDVLNERGSPFQRHLVDAGWFTSIECDYLTRVHVGSISFRGETTPTKASAALTLLLGELDQLGRLDGVTEEDFAIARQRRRVRSALALELSPALAPSLARWWASGGIDYFEGYSDRVNEQHLDDLQRFARSYIVSRPRVIAVLAQPAVIDRIRVQLRGSGSLAPPP